MTDTTRRRITIDHFNAELQRLRDDNAELRAMLVGICRALNVDPTDPLGRAPVRRTDWMPGTGHLTPQPLSADAQAALDELDAKEPT